MRRLIPFLLSVGVCLAQPVVSNPTLDTESLGDSSLRIYADFDVTPSALRFRVKPGNVACDGTGGLVFANTQGVMYRLGLPLVASGLIPSTAYTGCVEASTDSFATFSTGSTTKLTFTTTARVSTPIAPTAVNVTMPAPSGTTYTALVDCSNLQALVNAAVFGDVIQVPGGTVCTPTAFTLPTSKLAKSFTSSDVQTSTGTITIPNHGWTAGTMLRLGADLYGAGAYLPGNNISMLGGHREMAGGWHKSTDYCMGVPDVNHVIVKDATCTTAVVPGYLQATVTAATNLIHFTASDWRNQGGFMQSGMIPANTIVQFAGTMPTGASLNTDYYLLTACSTGDCSTKVSLTASGAEVDFTTDGTVTLTDRGGGTMYISPAPDQFGQRITIRPVATLPPWRLNSGSDADLWHMRQATPYVSFGLEIMRALPLAHNFHIQGMVIDCTPNTDYLTVIDVRGCGLLFASYQDTENILFDRIRIQGPGYPNRFGGSSSVGMYLDGRNIAVINSDLRELNYWHPNIQGYNASVSSGKGRISSGTVGTGASIFGTKVASTNSDLTITSGTAGTVYVYFGMTGILTAGFPGGMTGSWICSPGITCGTAAAITAFPRVTLGGSSRKASCQVATLTVSGGVVTAVSDVSDTCFLADNAAQQENGSQAIIAGRGPGPFLFKNNYVEGSGIPVHIDDSGGWWVPRGDYSFIGNWWEVAPSHCRQAPTSDGMRYGHRNTLEFKGGDRILIDGNIFRGQCSEISAADVSIAFTPRAGGQTSDVKISNTMVLSGAGGMSIPGPQFSPAPVSRPVKRVLFENNALYLEGDKFRSFTGGTNGHGWSFYGGSLGEDIIFKHNTAWGKTGYFPLFSFFDQAGQIAGVQLNDNVFTFNGGDDSGRGSQVGVTAGSSGIAAANAVFSSGGVNDWTASHNAYVPLWTTINSGQGIEPSGIFSLSTACTFIGGTLAGSLCNSPLFDSNGMFFNQATAELNRDAVGYNQITSGVNVDFRLAVSSPLRLAGTAGSNIGVNMDTLLDHSLDSRDVLATGGISSLTVTYTAPDSAVCYVKIGSTVTADSGGAVSRSTPITGLSAGVVSGTVICYHDQTAADGYPLWLQSQFSATVLGATRGSSKPRGSAVRGATTR